MKILLMELKSIIESSWKWRGFIIEEILEVNKFGNIIFKSNSNEYWRICPEELSCDKIAHTSLEFVELSKRFEFTEDWNMEELVEVAHSKLGELKENERYCLYIPAVIGGEYAKENIGKIDFAELISCSGDLAYQIKDLEDGQDVKLVIKS